MVGVVVMKEQLEILESKVKSAIDGLTIPAGVEKVIVKAGTDQYGEDLLRVILESKVFERLSDEELLKLGDTVDEVMAKSDERSSLVYYSDAA